MAKLKLTPQGTYQPKDMIPVRRGAIYCAPFCGHGCTKADFDKATTLAKGLAIMLGPNWKPEVSENLGWHYSARSANKHVRVTPGYMPSYAAPDSYTAYVSDEPTDSPGGHYTGKGPTPLAAVADAVQNITRAHDVLRDVLIAVQAAQAGASTNGKEPPRRQSNPQKIRSRSPARRKKTGSRG